MSQVSMQKALIDRLAEQHTLQEAEYAALLRGRCDETAAYAAKRADAVRREVFGTAIYIRGLIELSNFCKNDCLYCGIRRSNRSCRRYRLTEAQILSCCAEGYALGFRTFVLQGGEDGYYSDAVLAPLLRQIKANWPDCAVTLSLGERSRASYETLYQAGADRYLLRHETADAAHYGMLHPPQMSFQHRMQCLRDLQQTGYQVGCGFMVGSPGQTVELLAKDLKFVEQFRPAMCGIGPFLPHHATPFAKEPAGSLELTVYLLSLLRLMHPGMLLPATTALATLHPKGRERGILAGANVVMPNLSPPDVRQHYCLYDHKKATGSESAQDKRLLEQQMEAIGYAVVTDRGDTKL